MRSARRSNTLGPVMSLSDAKKRVLDVLKRRGPVAVGPVARELDITEAAVRQHLTALEQNGLVGSVVSEPHGPGRPATYWALTSLARDLFPDRHADLTVELIDAIRTAIGPEGLAKVMATRAGRQSALYAEAVADAETLGEKVAGLAARRTGDGYMAEVVADGDDYILVEHNCPVCEAAASCGSLCDAELRMFDSVLGPQAVVVREQHLLSGDERCAYRVSRRPSEG